MMFPTVPICCVCVLMRRVLSLERVILEGDWGWVISVEGAEAGVFGPRADCVCELGGQ